MCCCQWEQAHVEAGQHQGCLARLLLHWWTTAAQGIAGGQASLGMMYEKGLGGLKQSDVEAVKCYQKAASQGVAAGQANLGLKYAQG